MRGRLMGMMQKPSKSQWKSPSCLCPWKTKRVCSNVKRKLTAFLCSPGHLLQIYFSSTNCKLALLHWNVTASEGKCVVKAKWKTELSWLVSPWGQCTCSVWLVFHKFPACHNWHHVTSFVFQNWRCWRERWSMIPPWSMQNHGKFLLNFRHGTVWYDLCGCVISGLSVWNVKDRLWRGHFMQQLSDCAVYWLCYMTVIRYWLTCK